MTRVVVLGGGFAGLATCLRKQIQVALDWGLVGVFPRDSAIMRSPLRCPICMQHSARRGRDAA